MHIGQVIRKIRKQKKATLEDIAHLAGTTASNLSRIERGKHQYSPDMLSNISAALGVTVASLHAEAEPILDEHGQYAQTPNIREILIKEELPRRDQQLLENFNRLNTINQELIDGFIRLMLRKQ